MLDRNKNIDVNHHRISSGLISSLVDARTYWRRLSYVQIMPTVKRFISQKEKEIFEAGFGSLGDIQFVAAKRAA